MIALPLGISSFNNFSTIEFCKAVSTKLRIGRAPSRAFVPSITTRSIISLKSAVEKKKKKKNDNDLVKELLKLGADSETTSTGDTALHKAISLDYLDIARTLLIKSANPNAQDVDGWTPLHLSQSKKPLDLLQTTGQINPLSILLEKAQSNLLEKT